jgi:putative transferase (TIGR04331 family)
MRRVLVTTALESSWPDEEPVLFLGEWCRRFSRRDHWSNLDHEVLIYHWDDHSLFAKDFQYVSRLYERILVDLAYTLNRLLLVDHGIRYWRILIGPWLRQFIEILCDRWRSIECVVDRAEVSYTIVLDGSQSVVVPMDIGGFHRLYNSEGWNHGVYAAILERFPQVERRHKHGETSATSMPPPAPLHLSWKREPKVAALAAWSQAAARQVCENGVVLVAPYMSWSDELAVQLRFRQVPLIWSLVPQATPTMESGTREWSLSGHPTDPFDQFVREMIPVHIPNAYSDGYPELMATVDGSPWPKKPRLIFTSNAHVGNDLFKAWAAQCVEDDSQLVVGQHGGMFGNLKFCSNEDHDRAISDAYLTWGWTDPNDARAKPVGQLVGLKPLTLAHNSQERAVLVTVTFPQQAYRGMSLPIAGQWLDYLEDQFKFVEALPEHIRSALLVRLFYHDHGWDQEERWQCRWPEIELDPGHQSIHNLIAKSRVYIVSYNGTPFHESLALGVPTIMYWNPEHFELRDAAAPSFSHLERAGILHYSPVSAAKKVAEIWDDPDGWWASTQVLSALNLFSEEQNQSPDSVVDRVAETLREIMDAPKPDCET